jgi:hypothetical protein
MGQDQRRIKLNDYIDQESRCGDLNDWSDQKSHLVSKCLKSNLGRFWIKSFNGWSQNKL